MPPGPDDDFRAGGMVHGFEHRGQLPGRQFEARAVLDLCTGSTGHRQLPQLRFEDHSGGFRRWGGAGCVAAFRGRLYTAATDHVAGSQRRRAGDWTEHRELAFQQQFGAESGGHSGGAGGAGGTGGGNGTAGGGGPTSGGGREAGANREERPIKGDVERQRRSDERATEGRV